MPDGSKYDIPVDKIAENRAEEYKEEFGGDLQRSLIEDTIPLFDNDDYSIEDWAANNMNWSDISMFAKKVKESDPVDYQEGWINGEKEIIEDAPDTKESAKN